MPFLYAGFKIDPALFRPLCAGSARQSNNPRPQPNNLRPQPNNLRPQPNVRRGRGGSIRRAQRHTGRRLGVSPSGGYAGSPARRSAAASGAGNRRGRGENNPPSLRNREAERDAARSDAARRRGRARRSAHTARQGAQDAARQGPGRHEKGKDGETRSGTRSIPSPQTAQKEAPADREGGRGQHRAHQRGREQPRRGRRWPRRCPRPGSAAGTPGRDGAQGDQREPPRPPRTTNGTAHPPGRARAPAAREGGQRGEGHPAKRERRPGRPTPRSRAGEREATTPQQGAGRQRAPAGRDARNTAEQRAGEPPQRPNAATAARAGRAASDATQQQRPAPHAATNAGRHRATRARREDEDGGGRLSSLSRPQNGLSEPF